MEGDVATLPFPDQHFDFVVSTLSLHHWPDPVRGLHEVYRVLKPGGEAYIYDLPDWLQKLFLHGKGLATVAAASPFGDRAVKAVR